MHIIVFVPGIMGSTLVRPDNVEVWPPTAIEAGITGYRRTDDLVRSDLRAGVVIRSVCIDFYGKILNRLAAAAAVLGGILVEHPYDWRRDLATLSDQLGARLDALIAQHGPGSKITLVCHSMGGLVARGWLEHGPAAQPGLAAVELAAFLAVPHEGAPLALARAIGAAGASVGLSPDDQRRLSGLAGFPAAYQLFPPQALVPIWRLDGAIPFAGRSALDPALVEEQGLSAVNRQAAIAFHARLNIARQPAHCRYFAVASATHSTITRFDESSGTLRPVAVAGAGDGTVPVRSAAALPVQTAYVDADHVGVTQHENTLDLLDMLLGVKEAGAVAASFAARGSLPAISISPQYVSSGEDYEIVVLPGTAAPMHGSVVLEQEGQAGVFTAHATIPIEAASPLVNKVTMTGPTPLPPGRYRARLLSGDQTLATANFVVMQIAQN